MQRHEGGRAGGGLASSRLTLGTDAIDDGESQRAEEVARPPIA